MASPTGGRWTGLRGLGGLLIALGVLPLSVALVFPGTFGAALFVAEIGLIVVGAGLLWWSGRRGPRDGAGPGTGDGQSP